MYTSSNNISEFLKKTGSGQDIQLLQEDKLKVCDLTVKFCMNRYAQICNPKMNFVEKGIGGSPQLFQALIILLASGRAIK